MLYLKTKIGNIEIPTTLEDYKIFALCPICNKEIPVNLSELLKEEDARLDNIEVFCRKCSKKLGY